MASKRELDAYTLRFAANECAKGARCNLAASRRAAAAGRDNVVSHRISDADALMRMATWLRAEAARLERSSKQKRGQ